VSEERRTLIKTASYEAEPGEVGRVLLLYSGGLDTSVMLKWIQDEYEAEVVALTVNLGQPGEDYHVVDAREEFAGEYVLPAIKANALYGGGYPLFTALGRPLIAKLAVEYAQKSGCDTIAHGCTGKGNDQVRIESTVIAVDPSMKIIAPVRGWQMGRAEEAPDEPEDVVVGFERGVPVSLNGGRLELVELLERAGEIGARHGVGIVDHIEDRIVGLKVRDLYEVPAAAII